MPRAVAIKVQRAPKQTRWTLGQDKTPVESPDSMMQANEQYFDRQPLSDYGGSHYDSHYDSQYDSSHNSLHSEPRASRDVGWKNPGLVNGGEFDAFDFHQTPMNEIAFDMDGTPKEERKSLNLNTHVLGHNDDAVGRHLLYETALLDTQTYEILDIGEVDALKKEQERLHSRIEAAQRKLTLESKVRNAAQNLQRLYSTSKRPDTPQSPDSPRRHRTSLLSNGRSRGGSNSRPETFQQAELELAASVKKVDELHEQVADLLTRRQEVDRKLLKHTAAVLAEEANRAAESAVPGVVNGHHWNDDDDDEVSGHAYSDFDGIRDILHGRPAGASTTTQQQETHLNRMQDKLEHLNSQLRNIISEVGQTLGRTPSAEIGLDQSDDTAARMDNRFVRIEHNLRTLEQQQREIKAVEDQHIHVLQQQDRDLKDAEEKLEDADRRLRGNIEAIEEHLEGVNGQLHSALLQASDNQDVPGLQEPPRAGEHGYQEQLQYMEEGLLTMEQLLQQRGSSDDVLDRQAEVEDLTRKNGEYEAAISSLWETLQSETATSPRSAGGEEDGATSPLKEPFSLQAFDSRVRRTFQRAQAGREQQDILRRQIQQQRELGGKSDMEKEQQIADIQSQHDQLAKDHTAVQEELSNWMMKHEHSEAEANQSREELTKTMEEIDELKRSIESKQHERDEMARQSEALQKYVEQLEARLQEMTDDQGYAESKHGEMHQNMEDLEGEVVRLTTELTMAKAELDGAYGTRAERAGAQAAEVEKLNEKNRELEEKHREVVERHREMSERNTELSGKFEEVSGKMKEWEEKYRGLSESNRELSEQHDDVSAKHRQMEERHQEEDGKNKELAEKNNQLSTELDTLRTEIETLRTTAKEGEDTAQLQQELQEMTEEFQELTRESITLEREREQLDVLVDNLRDRCDELEAQLSEEKLHLVGVKQEDGEREQRHILVLKQEFKRMMRAQRSEAVKVLRTEQEEKRKLEAELRKIRQANGPLAKGALPTSSSSVMTNGDGNRDGVNGTITPV